MYLFMKSGIILYLCFAVSSLRCLGKAVWIAPLHILLRLDKVPAERRSLGKIHAVLLCGKLSSAICLSFASTEKSNRCCRLRHFADVVSSVLCKAVQYKYCF